MMKPSELKKNVVTSVRINSDIKTIMFESGYTVQQLLDHALDNLMQIDISKLYRKKRTSKK